VLDTGIHNRCRWTDKLGCRIKSGNDTFEVVSGKSESPL